MCRYTSSVRIGGKCMMVIPAYMATSFYEQLRQLPPVVTLVDGVYDCFSELAHFGPRRRRGPAGITRPALVDVRRAQPPTFSGLPVSSSVFKLDRVSTQPRWTWSDPGLSKSKPACVSVTLDAVPLGSRISPSASTPPSALR